jgi:transposase InsO family protein
MLDLLISHAASESRHQPADRPALRQRRKRNAHNDSAGANTYGAPILKNRDCRLNGRVERSHRVDDQEFYQLLDKDGITDDIHLFNEKLREWEDYYNYHRPHGALDGQTPYERLIAKMRPGTSPVS